MKDTWYTTLNVDYGHILDVSTPCVDESEPTVNTRVWPQFDPAMATEITSEYYR